jgi:outer membrane protein assembly factor BamB
MRHQLWSVNFQGEIRASLPLRSSMEASVNAASPLACGQERWLVSAGYGVGAHLFQFTETGSIKRLWHREEALDCHYATPVRVGDHLYGFHGRQETGMHLRCLDIATGKVLWEAPDSVPGGTLLTVGDKILIVTERGELWIIRANPEKFDQLTAIQILRAGHRSHAAYSKGILVARDAEHLVAVRLRPE